MSIKSKLSVARSAISLLILLGATTNCGNAPSEPASGSVSEAYNFNIGFQKAMWGANCVDSSHTYADITIIVNSIYSTEGAPVTWQYWAGIGGGPPNGQPADPHYGCDKSLIIDYNCSSAFAGYVVTPPEAVNHWSPVMDCSNRNYSAWGSVNVTSAYYGTSSHYISVMDQDNGVRTHCQGFYQCTGYVEYKLWGDPAVGSGKKLWGTYTCSLDPNQTVHSFLVNQEANHQPYTLSCL